MVTYFADTGIKELLIEVDRQLPKEPAHCHLRFKGEQVGCILLENESKGLAYKSRARNGLLIKAKTVHRLLKEGDPEGIDQKVKGKGGLLGAFKKRDPGEAGDFIADVEPERLKDLLERYEKIVSSRSTLNGPPKEKNMLRVAMAFVDGMSEVLSNEQRGKT